MAKVINCECGYVVQGQTEQELLSKATDHLRDAHPELVGKVSDSDLLAMAEEV
jgi:predicted small metal-binding protein